MSDASDTGSSPMADRRDYTWSRRPFVGALPKVFHSPLTPAEGLRRLSGLFNATETVGEAQGSSAWIRLRAGRQPPASTLRLMITDEDGGSRIVCKFDASAFDEIDILIYIAAGALSFAMAIVWAASGLSPVIKAGIRIAVPITIVLLASVVAAHFAFRRWRQSVRDRLFDAAMIALGVPIE